MAEAGAFLEQFSAEERGALAPLRFAVCVGRFYEDLAQRLVAGAQQGFELAGVPADRHQVVELVRREIEALPFDVLVPRHPAERALDGVAATVHSVDDPLQHPHVIAEAGPDELAVLVLTEPVDSEDLRRIGEATP